MKLNPLDIRKQEFSRKWRGYDQDEVDGFLQILAQQWQELADENRRLEQRLGEQDTKLQHYLKVEEALEEALVTAREGARQRIANAEMKAASTIEEAERTARTIVEDADRRARRATADAEDRAIAARRSSAAISLKRTEIVARLRAFLASELELLSGFDAYEAENASSDVVERLDGDTDGIKRTGSRFDTEASGSDLAAAVLPMIGTAGDATGDETAIEGETFDDDSYDSPDADEGTSSAYSSIGQADGMDEDEDFEDEDPLYLDAEEETETGDVDLEDEADTDGVDVEVEAGTHGGDLEEESDTEDVQVEEGEDLVLEAEDDMEVDESTVAVESGDEPEAETGVDEDVLEEDTSGDIEEPDLAVSADAGSSFSLIEAEDDLQASEEPVKSRRSKKKESTGRQGDLMQEKPEYSGATDEIKKIRRILEDLDK